jgi:hypothetical protein
MFFSKPQNHLFQKVRKLRNNHWITFTYELNPTKNTPTNFTDGEYLTFYGALDYGTYWDDLPETIVIGINQRNNRMETAD